MFFCHSIWLPSKNPYDYSTKVSMPMIFHYFFAFFRIFKNFNQNIFIFLFFCATLSPKPVYVMNI